MKQLAEGHTASKWLSLDVDVGRLVPEAEALTTALYYFEILAPCALDLGRSP